MNKGTIDIEGVIGWEVTARNVKRELKDMGDVDEIDVFMNSPGGYIDDGFGTFTALKNHPAKINMHITGMAASMGSVIAMAGDTVTIEPTGMMMIHPPASIAWGTAVEMRKEADVLDKYESRLITAYKRRDLNISEDDLKEAVADETWYTAQEALDAGFVDSITDGQEEPAEATNAALEWLRVAKYKNAPEEIANKIKTNRAKSNKLKQDLILNDGSAVKTTEGTEMTKEVDVSAADIEAQVSAAVEANDEKWKALLSHENASNTNAVMEIAAMNLDAEKSAKMMGLVAKSEAAVVEAAETDEVEEKEATGEKEVLNTIAAKFEALLANSDVNAVNKNASTDEDDKQEKSKSAAELYQEYK